MLPKEWWRGGPIPLVALLYAATSLAILSPLLLGEGVPGNVMDWSIPPTKPGIRTFLQHALSIWWPHSLGAFDIYASYNRHAQLLGALPSLLGLDGGALARLWLFLTLWVSALGMFLLADELLMEEGKKVRGGGGLDAKAPSSKGAAFIAGWAFAFNPFRYNFIIAGEFFSFQIVYMLYPLTLLMVKRALTHFTYPRALLAALLLWISLAQPQLLLMLLPIILVLHLGLWRGSLREGLLNMLKTLLLFLLIAAPTLGLLLANLGDLGILSKLDEPIPLERMLGRKPYARPPLEALSLGGYPFDFFLKSLESPLWLPFSSLLVALVFAVAIAVLWSRLALLSGILFLGFLIMASGTLTPLGFLVKAFYSIPGSRIFQTIVYWMFPLPLLFSLALAALAKGSLQALRALRRPLGYLALPGARMKAEVNLQPLLLIGLIALLVLWAYPLYLGRYMNSIDLYKVDPVLEEFQAFLERDPEFYRVLYVPSESVVRFLPSSYQKGGEIGGNALLLSSPKPAIDLQFRGYPWSDEVVRRLVRSYLEREDEEFMELLQLLQVKYVVIRRDQRSTSATINYDELEAWLQGLGFQLWGKGESASIYENPSYEPNYAVPISRLLDLEGEGPLTDTPGLLAELGDIVEGSTKAGFWRVKPLGRGRIGPPELVPIDLGGAAGWGFRLSIPKGEYAGWELYHPFVRPQDWSSYDAIAITFQGSGSGLRLAFSLHSLARPNQPNYLTYTFEDDGIGPRAIVIPFKAMKRVGNPSLRNITLINLMILNQDERPDWALGRLILLRDLKAPRAVPRVYVERLSPAHYRATILNATAPFLLLLPEAYHPQWKAYLQPGRGDSLSLLLAQPLEEELHFKAKGYQNAWLIAKEGSYTINIYFALQQAYELGFLLQGALVGTSLLLILSRRLGKS